MEQAQKLVLLMRLRSIVGGPVLRVRRLVDRFGDGDRLGHGGAAVGMFLALHREFDGKDMLALQPPRFVVWAATMRHLGGQG